MRTLILACLLFHSAFGQSPLPRGEVVPRVACRAEPNFSYALYVPSGYREDHTWPVLFGFSPGGSGEEPVRLFQKAAERFGWIVAGSNDARNGPLRPALEASEALWKDVQSRFKVDPRRSCAVGFSGGARMALRLALRHPKSFAGVISFGAFGTGDGLLTGLGHLHFFLACGQEDFNHWELLEGREELLSRKWKAMADRFEGGAPVASGRDGGHRPGLRPAGSEPGGPFPCGSGAGIRIPPRAAESREEIRRDPAGTAPLAGTGPDLPGCPGGARGPAGRGSRGGRTETGAALWASLPGIVRDASGQAVPGGTEALTSAS